MCVFCSTSRAPISFVNSFDHLESTFAKCCKYSSSERTCNNELTLFVRIAVVLPLPTKPHALREPYLLEIYKKIGYALIIRYPSSQFQASLNE